VPARGLAAGGPPGGAGQSGGGAPQCQIVTPIASALETIEQTWNSQAGGQGAPTFGGSQVPDVANEIATSAGCPSITPNTSGGTTSEGTGTGTGGSTGGSTSGGSSFGTGGGSSSPATLADTGSGTGGGTSGGAGASGGTLAYTGEPGWVTPVGILAAAVALMSAAAAVALRRLGRPRI